MKYCVTEGNKFDGFRNLRNIDRVLSTNELVEISDAAQGLSETEETM